MWVLLKDFLLVSMGMGIGVVLMCILNVGKEADCEMKQLKDGNGYRRSLDVYFECRQRS